jgi:hypothetical protein
VNLKGIFTQHVIGFPFWIAGVNKVFIAASLAGSTKSSLSALITAVRMGLPSLFTNTLKTTNPVNPAL